MATGWPAACTQRSSTSDQPVPSASAAVRICSAFGRSSGWSRSRKQRPMICPGSRPSSSPIAGLHAVATSLVSVSHSQSWLVAATAAICSSRVLSSRRSRRSERRERISTAASRANQTSPIQPRAAICVCAGERPVRPATDRAIDTAVSTHNAATSTRRRRSRDAAGTRPPRRREDRPCRYRLRRALWGANIQRSFTRR